MPDIAFDDLDHSCLLGVPVVLALQSAAVNSHPAQATPPAWAAYRRGEHTIEKGQPMRPSRMNIIQRAVAVAVAVSVLAWNPASTSTTPPASRLCAVGVSGGGLHGAFIEPCELPSGEPFKSTPTTSASETTPPRRHVDVTVAIAPLFAHRILMRNALLSMIP